MVYPIKFIKYAYNNNSVKFGLNFEWEITSFSKTISLQNVLYFQQLSIACYQVSFSANNSFWEIPIVSSSFVQLC